MATDLGLAERELLERAASVLRVRRVDGASLPAPTANSRASMARGALEISGTIDDAARSPPARSAARTAASMSCAIATTLSTSTIEDSPLIVCSARKRSRTARGFFWPAWSDASMARRRAFAAVTFSSTSAR